MELIETPGKDIICVWPVQGLLDPRRGNLLHMTHNLAPDVQFDDYIEFVAYNTRTPASLALSITAWNLVRIPSYIWWTVQQFGQKMRDPIPGKTFCYATVDVLSAEALTSCSKDCHLSQYHMEQVEGDRKHKTRGVFFHSPPLLHILTLLPSLSDLEPVHWSCITFSSYYIIIEGLLWFVNAFLRTASQGTGLTRTG